MLSRHIGLSAAENAAPSVDDDSYNTWCFDKLYPVYLEWRLSCCFLGILLVVCFSAVAIQKYFPGLSWLVSWMPDGTMFQALQSLGVAAASEKMLWATFALRHRVESGCMLFKKTIKEVWRAVVACEMARRQVRSAPWNLPT